jgi:ubiquinone/menaquinone biosynthesis C-methylase UbiE
MCPTEDYLAHSFREVDAGNIAKMMRCLTYMDGLPDFQVYKSTIMEGLHPQPGSTVADLGCGLGFDVHRLAALVGPNGKAIGIDMSHALLTTARTACAKPAAASFLQADIQRLPLADTSLDACKIDRTLQHVEKPSAVLSEVFRTLRPGGLVVCSEPDWSTFVIDDQSLIASQIAALYCQGFRNPSIGHNLTGLLEDAGFIDQQSEELILSTPDFASSEIVFDLTQGAALLAAQSQSDEPLTWLRNMQQRALPLCCSVKLIIQFASRP